MASVTSWHFEYESMLESDVLVLMIINDKKL